MIRVIAVVFSCITTIGLITGCDKDDDNNDGGTSVNQQDRNFVMMAAMSNYAEITAGGLAATKAENQGIADYGQMMVDEHSAAGDQLKALADSLDLYAPDSLDAEHVALGDTLMSLTGAGFDSVYINSQINDHQKVITLFQDEADKGNHTQLRAFAEAMIPHLQEHLDMADSLANTPLPD